MPVKFIVWGPMGATNPQYTHASRTAAQNAARSMAEKHPGQAFYVCVTTDLYELPRPGAVHTDLGDGAKKHLDEDIPF